LLNQYKAFLIPLNKLTMIWPNQAASLSAINMISKRAIAAVCADWGNKQW